MADDRAKNSGAAIAMKPVPCDLAALVLDAVSLMTPAAEAKGLWLRPDLRDSLWLHIDPARIRQILFNLLTNAIRFTDQGGVTVTLRSTPTETGKADIQLCVSDTGKGIAADAQERIFGIFEQEDETTAARYGGTGLGLAISRQLATAMGGRLSVESAPGQGSAFRFAARFQIAAPATDQAPDQLAGPPLNLLVVEDHAVNRMVLDGYLTRMGHRFQMVETAEDALVRLRTARFDAVLMDVNLPGMSGIQAARIIQQMPGPTPEVIGISAHLQPEERASCHQAGMAQVLSKPVSPAELRATLANVASSAQPVALALALADLTPARVMTLCRMFLDSLPRDMAAIEQALDAQDTAAAARLAHRLRGASGNFHLPELVADLKRLEHALQGDAPAMASVMAIWPVLRQTARSSAQRLATELALLSEDQASLAVNT